MIDDYLENAILVSFKRIFDSRGQLVIGEFTDLPFLPQRFFMQTVDKDGVTRGEHAHKSCQQLLIPIIGEIKVNLHYKNQTRDILLSDPSIGLFLPSMIWASQHFDRKESMLLVLASEPYLEEDYIRSLDEYKKLTHQ
jgi:hypothetical protein